MFLICCNCDNLILFIIIKSFELLILKVVTVNDLLANKFSNNIELLNL